VVRTNRIAGALAALTVWIGPVCAQEPLTLEAYAKKVSAAFEARKKQPQPPEIPFILGHFALTAAAAEPTVQPVQSAGPAQAAPASAAQQAPLPEIKCSGTMQMPSGMMVIIGSGTYKVGDEVSGCKIVNITSDEVTFDFQGRTFTKPTR